MTLPSSTAETDDVPLSGVIRPLLEQFDDFRSSWRPAATEPTQPAASLPAVEDLAPVMLDAEATPKAGAAFDGQPQVAAHRCGDLLCRFFETACSAKMNDDFRGQGPKFLSRAVCCSPAMIELTNKSFIDSRQL